MKVELKIYMATLEVRQAVANCLVIIDAINSHVPSKIELKTL